MPEKKKIYPNPRFGSVEEEDKYWATHSPLDEGFSGEKQKEKQKRSSFLTIRLTGEELTRLRDISSARGMGPSTFIRALIKDALTPREQAELAINESEQRYKSLVRELIHSKAGRSTIIKDKAKEQYEAHHEAFCIIKLADIPTIRAKLYKFFVNEMYPDLLNELLATESIKIVTPGAAKLTGMKRIVKNK